MLQRISFFLLCLIGLLSFIHFGCDQSTLNGGDSANNDGTGDNTGNGAGNGPGSDPAVPSVAFTPVGATIAGSLIDLEFLPNQNGESLVITQDGDVYYLRNDFTIAAPLVHINVDSSGEHGLLNVAADPLYGTSNQFVYFYLTDPVASPDIHRVIQYQVNVNVGGGTFSLTNPLEIISFQKTTGNGNHNGGSLLFMTQHELAIGVGDGGDTPNLAQDTNSPLGKIHRVIPDRSGAGGFTLPAGQANSVYVLGMRNPFTLALDKDGDLFVGDVGAGAFEEINCTYFAGENYGWPNCEGPCDPPVLTFQDPIHGFAHGDTTFNDQDPEPNPTFATTIMVAVDYLGTGYGGGLTNRLIYNEFFAGWVRALTLDAFDRVTGDQHIGHLEGLTGLHMNPADGLLYGVSLTASDQVLRLDAIP